MKKNLAVGILGLFGMAFCWCDAGLSAQVLASASSAAQQAPATAAGDAELFKAISAGREQEVRTMLAADPRRAFSKDKNGNSALLFGLYMNQAPIANVILGYRKNNLDIFEAAALGNDEKLRALISENGTLLNAF